MNETRDLRLDHLEAAVRDINNKTRFAFISLDATIVRGIPP